MPAELIKRINPDLLYPPFLDKVLVLLAKCKERGLDYWVLEGFRSYGRSHVLYAAFLEGGPRAAPAGRSAHNFGLAVDIVLDVDPKKPGLQPRWGDKDFDVAIEEGKKLGLDIGAAYNDKPHFGWPGYVTAAQLKPLAKIYESTLGDQAAKLAAVWKFLDTPKET